MYAGLQVLPHPECLRLEEMVVLSVKTGDFPAGTSHSESIEKGQGQ